jgi:hypothetical protein
MKRTLIALTLQSAEFSLGYFILSLGLPEVASIHSQVQLLVLQRTGVEHQEMRRQK